jgi:uncharacterized protein DUF6350
VACLWAAGAAATGLLLAEALVVAASAASAGNSPPAGVAARVGGVLFLWFHHAGLAFETVPGSRGAAFGFTLNLAILGGTAAILAVLFLGGRAMARRAIDRGGATGLSAALHAAKVGVPYALLCLGVGLASGFTVGLPANAVVAGPVRIHASFASAVLWPLALGVAAGFGGGLRAARGRGLSEGAWERRARGALAGGWRMTVMALALSFGAFLVLAAVHPGDTRTYFEAVFRRGTMPGVTLLGLTALLTPNLAAWVLFPSMGACVTLGGATSQCLLSYGHFPGPGPGAGGGLGGVVAGFAPATQTNAPAAYLLFLLIPVAASVVGGVRAAARGSPASRTEATLLGAAGGAVFGALCAGLVLLASIDGSVGQGLGRSAGSSFRLGPDPLPSIMLALAWGIVGGALGALVRGPPPGQGRGDLIGP